MSEFIVRPLRRDDRMWIEQFITEHWLTPSVIAHGVTYYPHELPGFAAIDDDSPVRLLTYHIADDACEIVTLNSVNPGLGIGTALVDAVKRKARLLNCTRLWLITTNDNIDALLFYQKRGFVLEKLHRDAVTRARKMKPEIPLYGLESIPIRDEIELEMQL